MLSLIQEEAFSSTYKRALTNDLISSEDTSIIFFDTDKLEEKLQYLKTLFPESTHAIAIKSNPLIVNLKTILEYGFSLEAASMEEIELAKAAGAENHQIVFDSPVKTTTEIQLLAEQLKGIHVNANCIEELDRLKILQDHVVGLRINPLVDPGSPDHLSVSRSSSKFGVPISLENEIIQAALDYDNVQCLHVHIGSQIDDLNSLPIALERILDLARIINQRAGFKKIHTIDLGGGFPVNYQLDSVLGMEQLRENILRRTPQLFSEYKTITEFGRFPNAHTSWMVSEIEYELSYTTPKTIMVHLGADSFVREIYSFQEKHRKFILSGKDYSIKKGQETAYQIGGPLCFGGDFLSRNCLLPKVEKADKLVIADVGANTFSLWSRHCSRAFPKVIAYSKDKMEIIKSRESYTDIINFWS
ncbi:MAG: hypothetical protein KTR13_03720 [Saprospiraceae bacterium]|nr:hypothetical protein [Saprospiraceae bacterium]